MSSVGKFKFWLLLIICCGYTFGQSFKTISSKHYNVHYGKGYEKTAGDILEIAELVWPTMAEAYDSPKNYQVINIFLVDPGDVANGNAIYTISRVYIFSHHINWVMRGRRNWLGNVVAHELAHVFTLRQTAHLSSFDNVYFTAGTLNRDINYQIEYLWSPMIAPTWFVEGIAQFEAEAHGYDVWDSQRDLIVRDAFLTNSLPTLAQIETFDGDWISSERVYNTGFAFLLYLKDRFGLKKVRALTKPKPFFSFSAAVQKTFGISLGSLFSQWKGSLNYKYDEFKELPKESHYLGKGSYNHSLTFSSDDRYVAWIGNGDRDSPMDYIYWKNLSSGEVTKQSMLFPENKIEEDKYGFGLTRNTNMGWQWGFNPFDKDMQNSFEEFKNSGRHKMTTAHSKIPGSLGLEFNHDNTKLLTTRRARGSSFRDVWEFDFKGGMKNITTSGEEKRWHRLTWNERASYATYHPKLDLILFVRHDKGSGNIALLDSLGKISQLTRFNDGQQIYNPQFNSSADSIFFTLGIKGDEAIASIPTHTPSFDPFASLRDSAMFPDSIVMAKGFQVSFTTALDSNLDRDLFFYGDTLFWSSYYGKNQYNIFAKLPGDSSIYQVTEVRGQALEPYVRDDKVYYQGYEKQHFKIFSSDIALKNTGKKLTPEDSLPATRTKSLKYDKVFTKGEYRGKKIAWDITPYLSLRPQFVSDTNIITNLGLGLNVSLGDMTKYVEQSFDVFVSKEIDLQTRASYRLAYQGVINKQALSHTQFSWVPKIRYGIGRNVYSDFLDGSINIPYDDGFGILTVDANGAFDPAGDTVYLNETADIHFRDIFDQLYAVTPLPYNFYLGADYFHLSVNQELFLNTKFEVDRGGGVRQPLDSSISTEVIMKDLNAYRHYSIFSGWGWGIFKYGTIFPTGAVFNISMSKINSTYSDSLVFAQTTFEECANNNQVCGDLITTLREFSPMRYEMRLTGVYSYKELFTLYSLSEYSFYSRDFPRERAVDKRAHPNLFPLFYRLGLSRMPGYPYNFDYNGRDILRGPTGIWSRVGLDLPLRIDQYIDFPFIPITSIKQFKLALIGNVGTTMNDVPLVMRKDISSPPIYLPHMKTIENEILFDGGFRLSMNFRIAHWLPMTMYLEAFHPYNDLQGSKIIDPNSITPDDIEPADYNGDGTINFDDFDFQKAIVVANTQLIGNNLIEELNSWRYYVGIALGHF